MLLPVLLLAAALPWRSHYRELVAAVERRAARRATRSSSSWRRQIGYPGERLRAHRARARRPGASCASQALPQRAARASLFVWMALLVVAGRALSRARRRARCAGRRCRAPRLARLAAAGRRDVAAARSASRCSSRAGRRGRRPRGRCCSTPALGFCVQGIAVVESLLLARGVPPSIIVLTCCSCSPSPCRCSCSSRSRVGLSDVWLDYPAPRSRLPTGIEPRRDRRWK